MSTDLGCYLIVPHAASGESAAQSAQLQYSAPRIILRCTFDRGTNAESHGDVGYSMPRETHPQGLRETVGFEKARSADRGDVPATDGFLGHPNASGGGRVRRCTNGLHEYPGQQ